MSRRRITAAIVTATALVGVLATSVAATAAERPWVNQAGLYTPLVAGDYAGTVPLRTVLDGQTLGLGTFTDLDGELVTVGGTSYRIGTDGRPALVSLDRTSPFVEGIRFSPERSAPVPPGTKCADALALVDQLAGTSNGMVAIRLRGTFTDLVTRSVPAQAKPYRPLAEVIPEQVVFPLGQRRAVLVGFRAGPDLAGVGAPGVHLHGVTADRSAGGHVLSCVVGPDVQLSIQQASGIQLASSRH